MNEQETVAAMAERAPELLAAMETARRIVGRVCSVDEEVEATEDFMRYAIDAGMKGKMRRIIDDGVIVWSLELRTGRGTLSAVLVDPREWKEAVEGLGLETP